MELSEATVERPETKLEGLESDRSLSAMLDLRCPERSQSCEGRSEKDHEASMSAKPHRPPLDLAAAPRVVGCTSTDTRRANRGLVGVMRVARVYGPKLPQHVGRRDAAGASAAKLTWMGKLGGS